MNDLPPEVVVFHRDKAFRRVNPISDLIAYQDEKIRVMKIYDIGATPFQGRWKIRIDIYDDKA